MGRTLKIRSATFNVDGDVVTVSQGEQVPEKILGLLPESALEPVVAVEPEDPPVEPFAGPDTPAPVEPETPVDETPAEPEVAEETPVDETAAAEEPPAEPPAEGTNPAGRSRRS